MKKKNILIIIITSIIILLVLAVVLFKTVFVKENNVENNSIKDENNNKDISNNGSNKENSDDNISNTSDVFTYEYENNKLTFYKNKIKVKQFEENYNLSFGNQSYFDSQTGKVLLWNREVYSDNKFQYLEKVILYDINKDTYKEWQKIYGVFNLNDENNTKYIVLQDTNNKFITIDLKGNTIKEMSDKEYVLQSYEGRYISDSSYNVKDNIIVSIKDKKYGLEKITNNGIIIEHKYEEIKTHDGGVVGIYSNEEDTMVRSNYELYQNKYVKVKEDGKWYLYELKTNKKINNTGYDRLYLLNENVLLVMEGKYFYIKDYNNNLLTNDNIYIENIFSVMPKRPEGIKVTITGDVCTIDVTDGTSQENSKAYTYTFNLKTKELKSNNSQ